MRKLYHLLSITVLLSLLTACGPKESPTSNTPAAQNPTNDGSVKISWVAPSTRSDGSYLPVNELVGYRVYMGTSSSELKTVVELSDEAMTSYTIKDLAAGSYYFAVSAVDANGLESGFSQVILVNLG